jgi:hypothetical protein
LLAGFLHLALLHKILKFLVGAQSEHFLPTAGSIASPKSSVDDYEKRFEFVQFRVGKHCDQLLGDIVGAAARKRTEI